MSLLIKNIVENQLLRGVKMVSGFSGESNVISWVNVMEILDYPNSVQREELLVTTGYKLENQLLFSNLIETLKNNGVSGIAIQTGYYIDEIPSYIISDSNRLGFPVLEIPKKLTFSEILHILIQKINTSKFDNDISDEITKSIYQYLNDSLKKYIPILFDEDTNKVSYLFYVQPINQYAVNEDVLLYCINKIKSYLLDRADFYLSSRA